MAQQETAPYDFAAPRLMERIDSMRKSVRSYMLMRHVGDVGRKPHYENIALLVRHIDEQAARLSQVEAARDEAQGRVAKLLAEFVAGIQPADIPSCLEAHSEPAFGEFLRGANSVHSTNLRWARWKAAEFGLAWPLPEAEFEFGPTPEAPAAPLLGEAAAPAWCRKPGCPTVAADVHAPGWRSRQCAGCSENGPPAVPTTTGEGKSDA